MVSKILFRALQKIPHKILIKKVHIDSTDISAFFGEKIKKRSNFGHFSKISAPRILKILLIEDIKHFMMQSNTKNVQYDEKVRSKVSFSELDWPFFSSKWKKTIFSEPSSTFSKILLRNFWALKKSSCQFLDKTLSYTLNI